MTSNDELLRIMERISDTIATDDEIRQFNAWCDLFKGTEKELPNLEEIQARILRRVHGSIDRKPRVFTLYIKRIIIAAASLVTIVTGIWFYTVRQVVHNPELVSESLDIAPGKSGATLTLANGKKIKLTGVANGEIAKEAGISVKKTADGQLVYQMKETTGDPNKINTLSTAKGETYILTLPDKSKVWLNAASSLTYSASLNEHGVRRVKLEGEAYFEIFKDKAHPFVVQTAKQEVEVLGTHFNINSYTDENAIATTLLEGSVKVTAGNLKQILKPGQQALNRDHKITVTTADIENVTDWKNGDFYLNQVDFRTAMRKIARWYDIEVIYDASVPDDIKSNGYISRTKKLSSVLKLIEESGQVHFRAEGRKIYVFK